MSIATSATAPSVPSPRARPPRIDAAAASPAPSPARRTLVSGSVTRRKAIAVTTATSARIEAGAPISAATATEPATSTATLNPLIASTWLMPAARKSAACGARPGSRTPVVIAETSARSPSVACAGIDSESQSFAVRRALRIHASTGPSSSGCTSFADVTSITAEGSRAGIPGFNLEPIGFHHPRTWTGVPRPGSGAMPATRTLTDSPSVPIDIRNDVDA